MGGHRTVQATYQLCGTEPQLSDTEDTNLEPPIEDGASSNRPSSCCLERVRLRLCDSARERDTRGTSVTQIFHSCLRQSN